MRLQRKPRRGVRIEMIPLMDVVFQLVVLFTYAMLSMIVPRGLRVRLPVASGEGQTVREPVAVTIGRNGELYVDRQAVPREELVAQVRQRLSAEPGRDVVIYGDKAAPLGEAVEVLGMLRNGGVEKVTFRVSPVGEGR